MFRRPEKVESLNQPAVPGKDLQEKSPPLEEPKAKPAENPPDDLIVKPDKALEPSPLDVVVTSLVDLTAAVDRLTLKIDSARLEMRHANIIETEKMRFNQFMDSMRSSYARLMKKMEKRLKNAEQKPGTQEDGPAKDGE